MESSACDVGAKAGTLSHRMDVTVQTGHTKAPRDVSLLSLELTSQGGEQVVFLMEILSRSGELKVIERECETVVQHALLETEGDAAQRLDSCLKELNGLLKGFTISQAVDEAHMILAILDDSQTLHVSHAGRAEAYLMRKGVTSQVTEYSPGKPVSAFVHIASGHMEGKDVVLFSTQRLLRAITPAQLNQMSQHEDKLLTAITRSLEAEREHAALALLTMPAGRPQEEEEVVLPRRSAARTRKGETSTSVFASSASAAKNLLDLGKRAIAGVGKRGLPLKSLKKEMVPMDRIRGSITSFLQDLADPKRKKRAHMLLLAGALAVLLGVWATTHLLTTSQRSKTKAELQELMVQINEEIQTAENRRIIGDIDSANAVLQRAQDRAKQVMDNESGLFRMEALDLLETIRSKQEELNNVIRLSPRVVANLASKSADVQARGMIGVGDGEFLAYDEHDLYRVVLNAVEDPKKAADGTDVIVSGTWLPRFSTSAFLTSGHTLVEVASGQISTAKTDDPAGWVTGTDIEGYLRFLYVLSPDAKQIYKYEKQNARYGAPVGYNVNGDLTGAIDMAIDGNVYVLKEGGTVLKLFRGEAQPFSVRRAPEGVLAGSTKVFKVGTGNFYFLDPAKKRVIVTTDGGTTGESTYVRQYVLEGDQVGTPVDLYIDPEQTKLFVSDEKRIYAIDILK